MARVVAVDFDGVLAEMVPTYDAAPPRPRPGARRLLQALKRAGWRVLIWSARANRALRFNHDLDPLGLAARRHPDHALEQARYRAMVDCCEREFAGLYDAIDDGAQGKPEVSYYIDDRALRPEDALYRIGEP